MTGDAAAGTGVVEVAARWGATPSPTACAAGAAVAAAPEDDDGADGLANADVEAVDAAGGGNVDEEDAPPVLGASATASANSCAWSLSASSASPTISNPPADDDEAEG